MIGEANLFCMLCHQELLENGDTLAVWRMEESAEELLRLFVSCRSAYESEISSYKSDKRKIEYLAVRAALKSVLGRECLVGHEESGKPFIESTDNIRLSISHTKGYASVLVSSSRNVGVDVEQMSDRIFRVKNKFLDEFERLLCGDDDKVRLLLAWSAKEVIYKLVPGLRPEYWEQVRVVSFDMDNLKMDMEVEGIGIVPLFFTLFPDFVLVRN